MPATQTLLLDTQKAFIKAWKGVGLDIPLLFEDNVDHDVPVAVATLQQIGQWVYNTGRTVRMQIEVEVRLPQGSPHRQGIEVLLEEINNRGKALSGVVEFMPSNGRLSSDKSRFAGKKVELLPYSWELWISIERA